MEYRAHLKLRDKIENEQRDIALIAAPGMGLTTLLEGLHSVQRLPVAWLDKDDILTYWETEYRDRSSNRRFVIHASTIRALADSGYVPAEVDDGDLFRTNLAAFLRDNAPKFCARNTVFVIVDGFDDLPDDLALVVCKELKRLDDMRSEEQFKSIRAIRFVLGGAIDFHRLFQEEARSGVSPATNFCKYRSSNFLLSADEAEALLHAEFPRLRMVSPGVSQLIIGWADGYLHYILEFAKWILEISRDHEDFSVSVLLSRLKDIVEEQDRIALFQYCHSAWDDVKGSGSLMHILATAVSAGRVSDRRAEARRLAGLGLLIEDPGAPGVFYPANKLVEIFLRQRLAERSLVLPIGSTAVWPITSLNSRAYELVLEIENRLRDFIGDQLLTVYGNAWIDDGLKDIECDNGRLLRDKALKRRRKERDSIYTVPGFEDPFLTFLDFTDLRHVVEGRKTAFPLEFADKLPWLVEELTSVRRRVAHNRRVTMGHIESLKSRWQIIQRMMTRRS